MKASAYGYRELSTYWADGNYIKTAHLYVSTIMYALVSHGFGEKFFII